MDSTENQAMIKEINETILNEDTNLDSQFNTLENYIKRNSVEFDFDNVWYRVSKPTIRQQDTLEKFKHKYKLDLIKQGEYLFASEWLKIYKDRGIDIENFDAQIDIIKIEIEELQEKALKEIGTQQDKVLKQIVQKKKKADRLYNEKQELLSGSLENRLDMTCNMYLLYLVLQTEREKGVWVNMFDDFNGFLSYANGLFLLTAERILKMLMLNE